MFTSPIDIRQQISINNAFKLQLSHLPAHNLTKVQQTNDSLNIKNVIPQPCNKKNGFLVSVIKTPTSKKRTINAFIERTCLSKLAHRTNMITCFLKVKWKKTSLFFCLHAYGKCPRQS